MTGHVGGRKKLLIVDDNDEGRFLLSKTLLRKFPRALIHECQDLEPALDFVRGLPPDPGETVIIAHRAGGVDGFALVSALRREHATVPIIWISGADRSKDLRAAGATRFLNYDAWLMIGNAVQKAIDGVPVVAPRNARAGE